MFKVEKITRNEEYEKLLEQIAQEVESDYIQVITPFINEIKSKNLSEREIIKEVYDYLVNNFQIDYDYMNYISHSGYAAILKYQYKNYPRTSIVSSTTKYGIILHGKGVCKGFLSAFNDICERLGVITESVSGIHIGIRHGWNLAIIDNVPLHIDVFAGITNKNVGKNPDDYLLVRTNDLINTGFYKNFFTSQNEAVKKIQKRKEEMIYKYIPTLPNRPPLKAAVALELPQNDTTVTKKTNPNMPQMPPTTPNDQINRMLWDRILNRKNKTKSDSTKSDDSQLLEQDQTATPRNSNKQYPGFRTIERTDSVNTDLSNDDGLQFIEQEQTTIGYNQSQDQIQPEVRVTNLQNNENKEQFQNNNISQSNYESRITDEQIAQIIAYEEASQQQEEMGMSY